MTPSHLRGLWTVIGFVLFAYAAAAWLRGQGAMSSWDKVLIDDRPTCVQLFAIFVCGLLFILETEIGTRYARRVGTRSWHSRLPVVASKVLRFEHLDTGSSEGKWYQRFWLFIFVIFPAMALVYFTNVVLDGRVIDKSNLDTPMGPLSGVPVSRLIYGEYWSDAFRFGPSAAGTPDEQLDQMVTWFPILEPIVIGLLLAGCIIQLGRLTWALLRP